MIWKDIYENLCNSRMGLKESWGPDSGLHRHHIVPKHMGGLDESTNFTYLTVREHIIAHYLLWRINRNPNDLRAMKMLGGNLTIDQRRITGEFCRDNKIGFFGASKEQREEWSKKGAENNPAFQYWLSPEGQSKRASMGGTAGAENNPAFQYWLSPEGQSKRASMGGKSHVGKKSMYKPGDNTFIRVKAEDIESRLAEGYIFGSPLSPNKGKSHGPSSRRKKVTDGSTIYNSLEHASIVYSVSSATILNWCRSDKKSNWSYL